jgi:hypothetical protein
MVKVQNGGGFLEIKPSSTELAFTIGAKDKNLIKLKFFRNMRVKVPWSGTQSYAPYLKPRINAVQRAPIDKSSPNMSHTILFMWGG